jgi:hypothetical protein
MYPDEFKYPSEWTDSWDNYLKHKDKLMEHIRFIMQGPTEQSLKQLQALTTSLTDNFFSANKMIEVIKSYGK